MTLHNHVEVEPASVHVDLHYVQSCTCHSKHSLMSRLDQWDYSAFSYLSIGNTSPTSKRKLHTCSGIGVRGALRNQTFGNTQTLQEVRGSSCVQNEAKSTMSQSIGKVFLSYQYSRCSEYSRTRGQKGHELLLQK